MEYRYSQTVQSISNQQVVEARRRYQISEGFDSRWLVMRLTVFAGNLMVLVSELARILVGAPVHLVWGFLVYHFVDDWVGAGVVLDFPEHPHGCSSQSPLQKADVAEGLIRRFGGLGSFEETASSLYRSGDGMEACRGMVVAEEACQVGSNSFLGGFLGQVEISHHVDAV